jgi:hypothetical protein
VIEERDASVTFTNSQSDKTRYKARATVDRDRGDQFVDVQIVEASAEQLREHVGDDIAVTVAASGQTVFDGVVIASVPDD